VDALWRRYAVGQWSLDVDAHIERFVANPSATRPRQALPWRFSSVLATARRVSDDSPASKRLVDAVATTGLLGLGLLSPGRRLAVDRDESLLYHVADVLNIRSPRGIVLLGPPRANQKPVIQVHDRLGRTIVYIKVAWNDLTGQLLTAEERSLRLLSTAVERCFGVPTLIAAGFFGQSNWLAIEPLRVKRRRRASLADADRLARAIEHSAPAWSGGTRGSPYVVQLASTTSSLPTGRVAFETVLQRWGDHPIDLAAGHGDFVPWNMLNGDPEPAVWDWERYRTAIPVGFDRIHYRVQVALHRRGSSLPDVLRLIEMEIESVLPDVTAALRKAHLDWYLVDMLSRYEADAGNDPTGALSCHVQDLHHAVMDQ